MFMMVHHPQSVFESFVGGRSMDMRVTRLVAIAKAMNETFRNICRHVQTGPTQTPRDVPLAATVFFMTGLLDFAHRFAAWKVPDEAKLRQRIDHALRALYQARSTLPDDQTEANTRLMGEFARQIDRLRQKMVQIAGQPALDAFDADLLVNPLLPVPSRTGTEAAGTNVLDPNVIREFNNTNEVLAHQLLLDPSFQIREAPDENLLPREVRRVFTEGYWSSLLSDLQLPFPEFTRVLPLVAEIRSDLFDLIGTRGGEAEANGLDEMSDYAVKTWTAACETDWEHRVVFVQYLAHVVVLAQLQARRQETETAWSALEIELLGANEEAQPRVFIAALRFLLEGNKTARLDAANARLSLIAPVVQEHGITYEQGKFMDRLTAGTVTLTDTHRWMELSMGRHPEFTKHVQREMNLYYSDDMVFRTFFANSFVSLVMPDVPSINVPETLWLDKAAMLDARREAAALIRTSCDLVEGFLFTELIEGEAGTAQEIMMGRLRRSLSGFVFSLVSVDWECVVDLDFLSQPIMQESLGERFMKLGKTLSNIARINYLVHGARYYQIIRESPPVLDEEEDSSDEAEESSDEEIEAELAEGASGEEAEEENVDFLETPMMSAVAVH
jgi:hypothetical protein